MKCNYNNESKSSTSLVNKNKVFNINYKFDINKLDKVHRDGITKFIKNNVITRVMEIYADDFCIDVERVDDNIVEITVSSKNKSQFSPDSILYQLWPDMEFSEVFIYKITNKITAYIEYNLDVLTEAYSNLSDGFINACTEIFNEVYPKGTIMYVNLTDTLFTCEAKRYISNIPRTIFKYEFSPIKYLGFTQNRFVNVVSNDLDRIMYGD